MSVRSTDRRSRIRRSSAVVLLASGLTFGASTVASAGSPVAAHTVTKPSAADVIGLKKGAYGDNVKALQEALNRVGIGVKYGVDGYFGSATQASVKAFQNYKKLPVTGVVDAATASALGFSAPAAPSAPSAPKASGNGALARGSRGASVTNLQQLLSKAGFSVGAIDGIYGPQTQAAVQKFQQANGLSATGTADAATVQALQGGKAPAAPAAPAGNATSVIGLQVGSRGPAVVTIQKAIMSMGWTIKGGADGVFGASTRAALIRAQKANGVKATGTVTEATARLFGLADGAPSASAPAAQPAGGGTTANGFAAYNERGARVVALQQALINAGVPVRGGADGVFGSGTAAAIMTFQKSKGLKATGTVDSATASALGLAAAAAPVVAPTPSVTLESKIVQGPCFYGDTWNAARGNGRTHMGVDIGAAEGKELYAAATGKVIQIYTPEKDPLAGNGVKIARADGTYFFYAHLSALAPGIAVGTPVTAGQVIGYVGHTGNAGIPHLHFEVHPGGGAAVNPYPIVKAIGAC